MSAPAQVLLHLAGDGEAPGPVAALAAVLSAAAELAAQDGDGAGLIGVADDVAAPLPLQAAAIALLREGRALRSEIEAFDAIVAWHTAPQPPRARQAPERLPDLEAAARRTVRLFDHFVTEVRQFLRAALSDAQAHDRAAHRLGCHAATIARNGAVIVASTRTPHT